MRKILKSLTYSVIATMMITSASLACTVEEELLPVQIRLFVDPDDPSTPFLLDKLQGVNEGRFSLTPKHLYWFGITDSSQSTDNLNQTTPVDITMLLDPKSDVTDPLLAKLKKVAKGKLHLTPWNLAEAISYVPEKGEPTVIDLIDKYLIFGQKDQFFKEVERLSDRGEPVARAFWGVTLAWANFASKNADYEKGMHLLRFAASCHVADANNSLGVLLDYEGQHALALRYLAAGTENPHDRTNLGLIESEGAGYNQKVLNDLLKAAKAGDQCGATALADYMANKPKKKNPMRALMFYLASYHGFTSMDAWDGFETILTYVRTEKFEPGVVVEAKADAKKWVMQFPAIFRDGFDQLRLAAKSPYGPNDTEPEAPEENSVQAIFLAYYAVGDKEGFERALQYYVGEGNANAYYMQAHLLQGFVGEPNEHKRREYLEAAYQKTRHPLAALALTTDLLIEAALAEDYAVKKLTYERAYDVAKNTTDKWINTEHRQEVADVAFLLGYMIDNGLGVNKSPKRAKKFFNKVQFMSPLALGYMARFEKDPVKAYAFMLAVKPDYMQGDWFNGVHHMQAKMKELTQEQQVEATKMAAEIRKEHPELGSTIYQKVIAGLNGDFS
jgi:TPR repeat protein